MPHIICEPCIGVKDRACPVKAKIAAKCNCLFILTNVSIVARACQFVQCRRFSAKTIFQTSGLVIPRRTRITSAWTGQAFKRNGGSAASVVLDF
jgi:hypothetical protein